MFSISDLKKHIQKQPFRPFRLTTSAGESFDIHHPELIMVGTRDVTIGLPSAGDPTIYEDQLWVAIMHLASIREIPAPTVPPGGNGQAAG